MSLSRYPQITEELLSAYLDDLVTEEERQLIERAIAEDPEIAWRVDTLQQTVNLLQSLPALALPRSFSLDETMLKEFDEKENVDRAGAGLVPPASESTRAPDWWQRLRTILQGRGMLLRNVAAVAAIMVVIFLIRNQLQPDNTPTSTSNMTASTNATADVSEQSSLARIEVASANTQVATAQTQKSEGIRTPPATSIAMVEAGDADQPAAEQPTVADAESIQAESQPGNGAVTLVPATPTEVIPPSTAEIVLTAPTDLNSVADNASNSANNTARNGAVATDTAPVLAMQESDSDRATMPRGDDEQPLIVSSEEPQNRDINATAVEVASLPSNNSVNRETNNSTQESDGAQEGTANETALSAEQSVVTTESEADATSEELANTDDAPVVPEATADEIATSAPQAGNLANGETEQVETEQVETEQIEAAPTEEPITEAIAMAEAPEMSTTDDEATDGATIDTTTEKATFAVAAANVTTATSDSNNSATEPQTPITETASMADSERVPLAVLRTVTPTNDLPATASSVSTNTLSAEPLTPDRVMITESLAISTSAASSPISNTNDSPTGAEAPVNESTPFTVTAESPVDIEISATPPMTVTTTVQATGTPTSTPTNTPTNTPTSTVTSTVTPTTESAVTSTPKQRTPAPTNTVSAQSKPTRSPTRTATPLSTRQAPTVTITVVSEETTTPVGTVTITPTVTVTATATLTVTHTLTPTTPEATHE